MTRLILIKYILNNFPSILATREEQSEHLNKMTFTDLQRYGAYLREEEAGEKAWHEGQF